MRNSLVQEVICLPKYGIEPYHNNKRSAQCKLGGSDSLNTLEYRLILTSRENIILITFCHKVSKSIGIIAKLRHLYIPQRLLLNIYHTLIAPYLTYCICAWGSCAQVYQKRLLVLQKRAPSFAEFGFGDAWEHAVPFFVKAKCLPLPFSFFFQCTS